MWSVSKKISEVRNSKTSSALTKITKPCNSHDIPKLDKAVVNLFDGSDHYRKYLPTVTQHGSWYKDYSTMMMENFDKLSDESLFSSEQITLSYSTGNKCAHIFQS